MKKVLITGAAGFLGSHLMLYHLRHGDFVLGIDDFSSSKHESYQTRLISTFSNGSLVRHDITNGNLPLIASFWHEMRGASDENFDLIYNFACPASPPRYQSMPAKTTLTCTAGVKNVFDLAKADGAVVVHASTSEIYGDPTVSPQKETYRGNVNSYGPRACYDEGKRAAEALCYDYLNFYDVDVRLVRIFNTYGPHMDPYDGRVVSNFINQALRGEDLTLYGDGSQTRSFCYVDDLIEGIIKLGSLGNNPGTPINIGNPHEFTVLQLAELVKQKLNSSANLVMKDLPVDDPTQRRPDISLARQVLGWEPKVQLSEGLDKTIEYFKSL